MKTEYVTLLTVVMSTISGLGGAFITGHFSKKSASEAVEKEHSIERNKQRRKEKEELLRMYVKVIKVDYEKVFVHVSPSGMMYLDYKMYNEEIRSEIYNHYHLVHNEVIEYFKEMEFISGKLQRDEQYADRNEIAIDENHLASLYIDMVAKIEEILDKERLRG